MLILLFVNEPYSTLQTGFADEAADGRTLHFNTAFDKPNATIYGTLLNNKVADGRTLHFNTAFDESNATVCGILLNNKLGL